MALNKLDANVEVVQTLGTYPNQENGLSAEELKEKFDEGSKILKEYLNEQVVPAVNDNAGSIEKNKQDIAENKKALEDSEIRLKAVEGGAVATDATLQIPGKPADAAAVGEELANMVARFKIEDDHLALNNTGDPAEAYEEIRSAYLANKTVLLYEDVENHRNIYLCVGYYVNKTTDVSTLYFARFDGSTEEAIELHASGYLTKRKIDLSAKLDKYTEAGSVKLYGVNSKGEQQMQTAATGVYASTLAMRGTGGALEVGAPTKGSHAATKDYVDAAMGNTKPDVYAAEYDFASGTLYSNFSEMVAAFQAGKIVTLSTVYPMGEKDCYYCVRYDTEETSGYEGACMIFQRAGVGYTESLYVVSDGTMHSAITNLGNIEAALDGIIEIQNSLIGGDGA